mmetsp:Transcript_33356/g.94497  ORF Transcript_33356/g.94497 Transcript_33356/m.94497 type:complete len:496 (+) Transcript_33356:160-1647(+)
MNNLGGMASWGGLPSLPEQPDNTWVNQGNMFPQLPTANQPGFWQAPGGSLAGSADGGFFSAGTEGWHTHTQQYGQQQQFQPRRDIQGFDGGSMYGWDGAGQQQMPQSRMAQHQLQGSAMSNWQQPQHQLQPQSRPQLPPISWEVLKPQLPPEMLQHIEAAAPHMKQVYIQRLLASVEAKRQRRAAGWQGGSGPSREASSGLGTQQQQQQQYGAVGTRQQPESPAFSAHSQQYSGPGLHPGEAPPQLTRQGSAAGLPQLPTHGVHSQGSMEAPQQWQAGSSQFMAQASPSADLGATPPGTLQPMPGDRRPEDSSQPSAHSGAPSTESPSASQPTTKQLRKAVDFLFLKPLPSAHSFTTSEDVTVSLVESPRAARQPEAAEAPHKGTERPPKENTPKAAGAEWITDPEADANFDPDDPKLLQPPKDMATDLQAPGSSGFPTLDLSREPTLVGMSSRRAARAAAWESCSWRERQAGEALMREVFGGDALQAAARRLAS